MYASFWTNLLKALFAGAILSSIPVAAAQPVPSGALAKEPERFAFIVGNSTYSAYEGSPSNLDQLPGTCAEAITFRKMLIGVGWQEDHLFPRVDTSAATTDEARDALVRDRICNLKNGILQSELNKYVGLLMAKNENAFGIVYYAGHGAENNGDYYAFGVDANVNFEQEISFIKTYPTYEMFDARPDNDAEVGSAVNITKIVSRISGPNSKALLVLIDACRDNPIMDAFLANRPEPPADMTPQMRERLSLGYITSKSNHWDTMLDNAIILYSTRAGQSAASGTGQQNSGFSRDIIDALKNKLMLRYPVATFVKDFETQSKRRQTRAGLLDYQQQVPQDIGSIGAQPVYCFRGCPQSLFDLTSGSMQLITAAETGAPGPAGPTGSLSRTASIKPRAPLPSARPRLQKAMFQSSGSPPVGLRQAARPSPADIANARIVAPQTLVSKLSLDVFYCAGDDREADRRSQALQYAMLMRKRAPDKFVFADATLVDVRLRSLDINANLASPSPVAGDILSIAAGDTTGKTWAVFLAAPNLILRETANAKKGIVEAFFCSDPSGSPISTVYTQVSSKAESAKAATLVRAMQDDVTHAKFVSIVDPVTDRTKGRVRAPNGTQVRYFFDDQLPIVQQIIASLNPKLTTPAVPVKVPGNFEGLRKNPVIEIWLGRNETKGWR